MLIRKLLCRAFCLVVFFTTLSSGSVLFASGPYTPPPAPHADKAQKKDDKKKEDNNNKKEDKNNKKDKDSKKESQN
jgi:hypothetical protein